MHEETEKRFCFFFQMIPPVLGKKGAKQNGKKVNRGAKRFWELFHHWVFCQSPTARQFCQLLGEGERPAESRLAAASTRRFEATQNEQFCMKNN